MAAPESCPSPVPRPSPAAQLRDLVVVNEQSGARVAGRGRIHWRQTDRHPLRRPVSPAQPLRQPLGDVYDSGRRRRRSRPPVRGRDARLRRDRTAAAVRLRL